MIILILGLVLFLGVHSVRMVAGGLRDAQLAANERRWKGLYSLASLVGFVLIVWGWIVFRPVAPEVYTPPEWGRYVTMILVLAAFALLPMAYMPPGYVRHWIKHPMVTAVILWSVGHLFANGDLASVLTFGGFLVWSVANRFAVIPRGDPAPEVKRPLSDLIAGAIGVVLFVIVGFWLHPLLFGVSPFA